ncbi:MAG: hypothetical protein PHE51_06440 [Eubacteriales bacterium]|nr:hypothetical protein [Eubacteriales bacterium]
MKTIKILALMLCFVCALSLGACKQKPQEKPQNKPENKQTKVEEKEPEVEPLENPNLKDPIEVKGLTEAEIKQYAKDNGAQSVLVNKDGSVDVEMTDEEYTAMMDKLTKSILDKLEEIRQSSDMIDSVQTGLDFDKYYIFVDKAKYEANPSLIDITSCVQSAELYQTLDGKKTKDINITLYVYNVEDDTELAKIPYIIKKN